MSTGTSLLAAILEKGSVTTFKLLDRNDFVDQEERTIYDYIKTHYRRYSEFPDISTTEDDTGFRLPDTPEHVDYYIDQLHQRTVYNGVRDEFGELRDSLRDLDIEGMLEASSSIRRICIPHTGQQQELMPLSEVASDVRDAYNSVHGSGLISGVPTGYRYLDEETNGYQNGDLVVWVARPGLGKTHTLIHQARAASAANRSVLFVSMEMTLAQIGGRYAAHEAGLDPSLVRKGKLSMWGRREFDRALITMGQSHNFHLFAGNFKKTTDDIDILIQELEPDIVYIDGMYLMKPANTPGRASRFESAAYVVDEVKRMTLMRNRPIVCTTQFGRDAKGGGKEGSMENIGYTDTVGTHASLVIAIKPGKEVLKNINHVVDDEIRLLRVDKTYPYRFMELMKGREGESGSWGSKFQFAPLDFSEVPLSEVLDESDQLPQQANLDHMA